VCDNAPTEGEWFVNKKRDENRPRKDHRKAKETGSTRKKPDRESKPSEQREGEHAESPGSVEPSEGEAVRQKDLAN